MVPGPAGSCQSLLAMLNFGPTPDPLNGHLHFIQIPWLIFKVERHQPAVLAQGTRLLLREPRVSKGKLAAGGMFSMASSSLSTVQDVSERAAWGVLVREPQHREADRGSPHRPRGPRVSSLLQWAAGGSRSTVNHSRPVPGTPRAPAPLQTPLARAECLGGGRGRISQEF